MEYLSIIRYELDALDAALVHVEEAARRIPGDRLDEHPARGGMAAGELIDHLMRGVQMTLRGVARGAFTEADMAELPACEATLTSPAALAGYVDEVRGEVRDFAAAASDEMLMREVEWFGSAAPGWQACSIAYQEALHHRGQIMTYLRIMGLEPVDVYGGIG